ncbi:MAG TPA: tetratricopeptide repeat protein [Ohtaekwangia sp.]
MKTGRSTAVIKSTLLLTLIFSSFRISYGCLNGETLILKNGLFVYEDFEGMIPFGHRFSSPEIYRAGVAELDSLYKVTNDLDYLSDKGILLIILGEYDKAIALYLEIDKTEPGRYSTASNIGTAYELAGNNQAALQWIKKAVAIDSSSHDYSEWIHVNILEQKSKERHITPPGIY